MNKNYIELCCMVDVLNTLTGELNKIIDDNYDIISSIEKFSVDKYNIFDIEYAQQKINLCNKLKKVFENIIKEDREKM